MTFLYYKFNWVTPPPYLVHHKAGRCDYPSINTLGDCRLPISTKKIFKDQENILLTENMADMTHFPRTEQICVYLVLILVLVNCQCNRRRIGHTITYHNCQPKRLMSWGCAGSCQAYSRPSSTVPGDIEHFCECCKHTEFETRRTILQCPSNDGLSFRRIRIRVNVPTGCACRPCSTLPQHIVAAEDELHNGKRTSNQQTVKNFVPLSLNETIEDIDEVDLLK